MIATELQNWSRSANWASISAILRAISIFSWSPLPLFNPLVPFFTASGSEDEGRKSLEDTGLVSHSTPSGYIRLDDVGTRNVVKSEEEKYLDVFLAVKRHMPGSEFLTSAEPQRTSG